MPKKSSRSKFVRSQVDKDDDGTIGSTPRSPFASCSGISKLSSNAEPTLREVELERKLAVARDTIARLSRCSVDDNRVPELNLGPAIDEHVEADMIKPPQQAVSPLSSLPKVELSSFDGNPVDYWKFIRQFECYVESKTDDSGQRLLYLMHYCRGNARKSIDACIMLPPEEGYQRARRILKDLYGLPHVVAHSMLNDLFNVASQVRNTSDSLSNLALCMENCQIALKQMNCEADLNSVTTLDRVVKCLPIALQHQWADAADDLSMDGCIVTFDHLTQFVSRRARVARSRFGQLVERPDQSTRLYPSERNGFQPTGRRKVLITTRDAKPCMVCPLCQAPHDLKDCSKFLEVDVKSRWVIAKSNAVCFVCLQQSHSAASCNVRPWCTAKNCGKRHHKLLHYDQIVENPPTNINCSQAAINTKVCLGSMPIKIETPTGLVDAVALLDNGSDTTLIQRNFVERYGMSCNPTQVTLTTLGHQRKLTCCRLNFKIHSLDGSEVIDVDDAYTVEKLPQVSQCPLKSIGERFTHLKDIEFPDVSDENVTVLIGCDVPEAHWTLEQRLGGKKAPFATKTPLGWVLQGPTSFKPCSTLSVHSSQSNHGPFDGHSGSLYNAEFADLSSDDDEEDLLIVSRPTMTSRHFQVPLPWKSNGRKTHRSYFVARKRLSYLQRRVERALDPFECYVEPVRNNIEKANNFWCLLHPVFNPKEPDKLRVVFDCVAKHNDTSSNDRLLQGPNLRKNLLDVLLHANYKICLIEGSQKDKRPEDDATSGVGPVESS